MTVELILVSPKDLQEAWTHTVGTSLILLVDLSNLMSISLKLDVAAMLLCISYLCLDMMPTRMKTHHPVGTSTVMPIRLEVSGAMRWISWKLIHMLGIQLHIIVIPLKASTLKTVIELVMVNLFTLKIQLHMVQDLNTRSTLKTSTTSSKSSKNLEVKLPQWLPHLLRIQMNFP